jgi:hypothetical protein
MPYNLSPDKMKKLEEARNIIKWITQRWQLADLVEYIGRTPSHMSVIKKRNITPSYWDSLLVIEWNSKQK